ncbi:MAG: hypothetical protein RL266_194 [Bacteroidota bacterium]
MKQFVTSFFVLSSFLLLSGCDKGVDKVLVGTWNVTQVEGVFTSGGASFPPIIDADPTGTITFRSNGTGEQDYSYSLGGTTYPQTGSFTWSATNDLIIIDRTNEADMEWTRIIDTDNKQVASYNYLINANQSWNYKLTLEK